MLPSDTTPMPVIDAADLPGVAASAPQPVVTKKAKAGIPPTLDQIAKDMGEAPKDNEPAPEPKADPVTPPSVDPVDPETPEPTKDKEENNGQLRKAKKELEAKTTQYEARIAELETKLATPGINPDQEAEIQAKIDKETEAYKTKEVDYQSKIAELEQYRDVVDITKNPIYIEKFVTKREILNARLLDVANQYGMNQDQLSKVLQAPNMSERERLMMQYKVTPSGVLSVVGIINEAQELFNQEQAFMKDKKGFKEQLDLELAASQNQSALFVKETIKNNSAMVWDSSVDEFRTDVSKVAYPTYQKTGSKTWDKAVEEADKVGKAIFQDFLKDLESNIVSKTITPALLTKAAKLAMSYGQSRKDQQLYIAMRDRVNAQAQEIARLKSLAPGFGGTTAPGSSKPSNNGIPKSYEEIAAES